MSRSRPRVGGRSVGLHSKGRARRHQATARDRRRGDRVVWIAVVLLGLAALLPGFTATGTFALGWTAQTNYLNSTYVSGSLGAPGGTFEAAASGNTVQLSGWGAGSNGNQQNLAVSGPETTSACSSSDSFSPVATLASTVTSFPDETTPVESGVQPGDYLCYQLLNGYGYGTTTLSSTVSGTVTSLPLASVPGPIASGDVLEVTNSSGQYQTFTASQSYAITTTATTVSVSSATTTATFGSGSTVADTTSWTSWTSSSSASGSYASAQVGFVADTLALANNNETIASGDTVTVAFNQTPNLSAVTTSDFVCAYGSTTVTKVKLTKNSTTATTTGDFYGVSPGMSVTGTGISSGTTVSQVNSSTQITLSKAATAAENSETASFADGTQVVLADATATGTTNNCLWGDTFNFGELVLSGTGAYLTNSEKYKIPSAPTNAVTLTIGALATGTTDTTVTTGSSYTWTFTPSALESQTGALSLCNNSSSSLCPLPATTTTDF